MRKRAPITLVLAAALAAAAPAGAQAGWESPVRINSGPLTSSERTADVAVGDNGLATAMFFENGRNDALLTRRPASISAWDTPVAVPFAPGATGAPFRAELAANAAGDVIGVYRLPSNPPRLQAVSWPADAPGPGAAVEVMQGVVSDPAIAIDDAGNGYVAASNGQFGVGARIKFARFDAASGQWGAPVELPGENPRLAVNGAGDLAMSYARAIPTTAATVARRLFARRQDAGASGFSDERQLDTIERADLVTGHDVAIDEQGAITVVFTEQLSAPDPPFAFPRAYAARWERGRDPADPELLSSPRPAFRPAYDPAVVVDPHGRVTATWREQQDATLVRYRLYSAERVDERGFGFPQSVSPASEHLSDDESSKPPEDASPESERTPNSSSAPYELAVDADGTATVAYAENVFLGEGDPDFKVSSRASGGRWSPLTSLRSPDEGKVYAYFKPAVAAARGGQVDVLLVQEEKDDGNPLTPAPRNLIARRFEGPPPPNYEHQTMVRSRHEDGTRILVQWCPAAGLEPGERAPTIIAGSGWGIPGRRCSPGNSPEEELEGVFGSTSVEKLTSAGYNVLTFDARGFWRSGGEAQVDDPLYEGKDMQALIDYVASQPDAQLDGPGDPRLGMSGGSYGGGIQFVTAALDQRVDAIAPAIAWNSLVTSLFPRETVKAGWAAILVGAGVPMTTLPGVLSPAGIQDGHMAQEVYDATQQGVAAGTIEPRLRTWFEDKGPHTLLDRIEAPTLLIQGTVDTMFPLDEAHRNFEGLRAAGTEVKMLWFCGGHGACERQGEDQEHIDARVLAWFDRHLRGRDVSTGPTFEWVDEDGGWHDSASYPPRLDSVLRATGSGTLSLTPGEQPGSGGVIFATPYSFQSDHPAAVDVPIEAPAEETTVLGAPQLRLTYTATGVTTYGTGVEGAAEDRTHVYAQIVDNTRNRVVGNQATAIPITLDGEEHQLSLPLERIASRSPKGGYSLQIVPQTSVYDGQRAVGTIDFSSIDIALPVDLPGVTAATGRGPTTTAARPGQTPRTRVLRCRGLKATITGTSGRDVIRGTAKRDVIVAGRGKDVIRSRGGRDVVCAGPGADRALGGKGADRLVGGGGRDSLRGGRGADRLFGGIGADRLIGGRGRDRLAGGAGRDMLRGDPRRDRLFGGPGRDRILKLR